MDLPDCPPGAEGYEDTVTEIPKKPLNEEIPFNCTKAEQEFQQHLSSLKIKTEDGNIRCMVERRGRDISGKWIYLCYPCAAVCSGESILQTHISGKKHKNKLSLRTVWPSIIFEEHPYVLNEKGNAKSTSTEQVLQKMAEEVEMHHKPALELDMKYAKYREVRCHIQDTLDGVKAPLLGVEYLIEHPPEQAHYEPSYICVLCVKQGHPRTIVNHLTCFWHRFNYLLRHFPKACNVMAPYRSQSKYREGVSVIMNRLAQRIQDKYGRLKPVNIDKEEYDKDRDQIHQWLFRGYHITETDKVTFEEVVDPDLITSLDSTKLGIRKNRDPSPPIVAAPTKPTGSIYSAAKKSKIGDVSSEILSDVSDEPDFRSPRDDRVQRTRPETKRYEPYPDKRHESPVRSRYTIRNTLNKPDEKPMQQPRPPNYEYKLKLAADQLRSAEELALKALSYHEKNPEKHPLYPDEWKKFWNRRYKEIQIEGKDPAKHDFKPEWIVFWTTRIKELHEDEMRSTAGEIYRRLRLTPPEVCDRLAPGKVDTARKSPDRRRSHERRRSVERRRSLERRKSPDSRRRSPPKRGSPEPRRRSPEPRRRSPVLRRRTPEPRRHSPELRRRNPEVLRRRSPDTRRPPPRRITPEHRRKTPDRRERRSLERHSPPRNRSPLRFLRTRSRSPIPRSQNPSPPRKTVRSPLSRRVSAPRNHSPGRSAPSLDTVLVSDEELKPDDGLSPWNSDDSLGSLLEARSPVAQRSRTGSLASRASRRQDMYGRMKGPPHPQDFGSAENVVATLRLLVALEDYLGSLGPRIVELLAEALKMEKDKANSSEDMLVQENAVVLIETAKEKLKGAVQAGLVSGSAAAAVRAAVVRAAATLHEADNRMKKKKQQQAANAASTTSSGAGVPVAGVGEVDREQIARQMAAALIEQGKTDVSAEELSQLVDAVVGMAEAKKREAESQIKVEARAANDKSTRTASVSGTASALQMLQFAYDDKKIEKDDAPDAMDGLSDSDLETLLKNFNELSAEEQHSLIAYLKKLEAREPERVERLRQYVSAAASNAPAEEARPPSVEPVTIESDDDDDYTVEDVFKSATEKVKEDRIRQEMEIVKKSLEETKVLPARPPVNQVSTENSNVTKNISSATNLLALVQAALKSTPAPTSAQTKIADVVASNTQPRSFGDLPEPQMAEQHKSLQLLFNNQASNQQAVTQNSPNLSEFGGNRNTQNELHCQTTAWEQKQISDDYNRGHDVTYNQSGFRGPQDNYNQRQHDSNTQDSQGFHNNYNQGSQGTQDSYSQGSRGSQVLQDNYNQGSRAQQDSYNQGSQGPPGNYNQEPKDNYNQESRGAPDNYNQTSRESQEKYNEGSQDNFNQGFRGLQNNFNQGTRGPQDNFNQLSRILQDNFNQGSRGPQDNFNQGSRGPQNNFNQGSRGPQDNFYQGARGPQSNFNQGSRGLQDNFNQGPRGPQDNFNQGSQGSQDSYNQSSRGPQDNYMQTPRGSKNQGQSNNFNQNNRPQPTNFQGSGAPQNNFNQGPRPLLSIFNEGSGGNLGNFNQGPQPLLDNYNPGQRGQDQFHNGSRGPNDNSYKGPRGNFVGNRNQDRPGNMNNQQFGNQQKNFRGRGGRGGYGGPRGRGRGNF